MRSGGGELDHSYFCAPISRFLSQFATDRFPAGRRSYGVGTQFAMNNSVVSG
jgi:hypothetical protein